jgi:tetratricopeptide (TPR) repeat protein
MILSAVEDTEPSTTSGTIAVVNLHAQIDGLAARVLLWVPRLAADSLFLIDLLLLRGHVLGRVADCERASDLAEQLVRDTTDQGNAYLARSRTRAAFHRFADALADLDAAERRGLDDATLKAERAAILQATGCYDQAEQLYLGALAAGPRTSGTARQEPGSAILGALAVLHAERGEVAEAERMFAEVRHRYQGISPFPLASLDFRRGLMWHSQGNLLVARTWLEASRRRVPAYAPALGLLAGIDTAMGAHEAAIGRLRPLASSSDDPGYAARLARALSAAGYLPEAARWRAAATEPTQGPVSACLCIWRAACCRRAAAACMKRSRSSARPSTCDRDW